MAPVRVRRVQTALVALLCICALVTPKAAQQPLLALPNDVFSNMTTLLAPLKPRIRSLLQVVQDVDKRVVTALHQQQAAHIPTCNYRNHHQWKYSLSNYFENRGWNHSISYACVSDVDAASISPAQSRRVFQLVTDYSAALSHLAPSIATTIVASTKPTLPSEWTNATRPSNIQSIVRTQQCTHDFSFFVMLNGSWYLSNRLTNHNPLITYPDGERFHLVEYDTIRNDVLHPLPMKLHRKPLDSAPLQSANTYIQQVKGSDTASEILPIIPQQNLAIKLALQRGEHAVEIANDAATPSNTAILLLPLVLNLIPVALIADVNTFGMIVYTLLTDVLTVVPLMVKGVELIIVSKQKTYASIMRITGANFEPMTNQSKVAELWVARCVPSRSFRGIGEALLVVALICMVGGVLAELVAMRWVAGKRRRANAALNLPTLMEDASRGKHE
ncbi:hypothetical protein BWQ96_07266 [Gracilariopsis chorda]|uniref:Uncharacterized protein n=1 Tax=Gracilariopsis chorda TaxID=448386 RepID=A0A2V3ILT6_9FLOR|nr:hypothetical protein BWQ96_07266 [Gracilariopsis chorda]|eukprot:PXF43018.1 hypothetical protein BWQ96_07266 [Gracilariopsis chorda]